MARLARLYAPAIPQYVLTRAIAGRTLVDDADDYRVFVGLLDEVVGSHDVALHAYVVLPDELRLLATPATAQALPRAMQTLGRRFVPLVNRRTGCAGPLWSGRYRSTLIDPDAHVLAAMRHIETRPVHAGLVDAAARWRWSSYRHHTGDEQQSMIADHAAYWALSDTPFERQAVYRDTFAGVRDDEVAAPLEAAVAHGWAFGDAAFLSRLAGASSRRVAPLPRGRKPRFRSVPK